jgi:hypothetical protein
MNMRMDSVSNSVENKYPRVHKASAYIADVWRETFPNEGRKVKERIKNRKEIA